MALIAFTSAHHIWYCKRPWRGSGCIPSGHSSNWSSQSQANTDAESCCSIQYGHAEYPHNGMMPAGPSFQFGAPEFQGAGSFPQPQPTFGVTAGDGWESYPTNITQNLNDARGRVNSQRHMLERLNTNVNRIGNMMHSQNQVLHGHGQTLNQLAGQLSNVQQDLMPDEGDVALPPNGLPQRTPEQAHAVNMSLIQCATRRIIVLWH
ncbi:hypothetical protein Vafri_19987 [Volvox africanus]|uniref:t-SNARE coiled-coil homology domain-containing protein n=1 Tax=Volvox africanus TaxID=51714 RepID=A0A8J4BQ47_9CHLO|nr:hypothetical protein Vafri_19987 [Volvox africanus]